MRRGRKNVIRLMFVIMLSAIVWLNVKPMETAAATGNDVGVIGVKTDGTKLVATLYGYNGDEVSTKVSFYRDGKSVGGQKEVSVENGGRVLVFSDEGVVVTDDNMHYYTAVISDDANWSNNNRTLIRGKNSGGSDTIDPEKPEPEKKAELADLAVACFPDSVTEGDASTTITVQMKNTGTADAGGVKAAATVGNQTFTSNTINIGAGQTGTVTINVNWKAEPGILTIPITVTGNGGIQTSGLASVTVNGKQETAVKDVKLTSTGKTSGSITLEWGLDSNGDVSPDSYEIIVTGDGKEHKWSADEPGVHTFEGLSPETEYSCTIVAKKGDEEKSRADITVITDKAIETENGVKQATVSAANASFTTVTLSWGYKDDSDGEEPTEYEISINGKTFQKNAPGTEVITGLEKGKTYEYTIVAKTGTSSSAAGGKVTTKSESELKSGVDLVISDIIWDPVNPAVGDQVTFSAVITNQGNQTSNNTKHGVRFYIDDTANGQNCTGDNFYWSDQYQSSLGAGQSVVVTVNGDCNMGGSTWTASQVKTHTVTAYVDDSSNNATGDSNRNNNYLTKNFAVTAAQPPVDIPVDDTNADNVNVAAPGAYGDKENNSVSVLVNGKASACIDAWVNTSCIWNQGRYETTPVTIFEMKKESVGAKVRVALPASKQVREVTVRPLSSGIKAEIVKSGSGSYIEFEVNKWGSYSVEFNGETSGALQVFVNPEYKDNQYSGRYLPLGTVTWDAWGFGGTVYGSGILCSNRQGAVISPGSGARYYGVTILNEYKTGYGGQGSWEVEIRDRSDVEFNYFHIIACSPNSDGISVQSSNNIRINDSYFRTWDDGIALKNYSAGNYTHHVYVNNTVYWTDLAQSMEIGAETNKESGGGPYINNVEFNNITVIHANHKPAISIHNMDNAAVSDVKWSNVVVEDACMGNNFGYGDGWPIVIDLGTYKGGTVPGTDAGWSRVEAPGSISNVVLENIRVLGYTNSDTVVNGLETGGAAGRAPGIRVRGENISGITIRDLYIGNMKIDSWAAAKREMYVTDTTGGNESKVTFE